MKINVVLCEEHKTNDSYGEIKYGANQHGNMVQVFVRRKIGDKPYLFETAVALDDWKRLEKSNQIQPIYDELMRRLENSFIRIRCLHCVEDRKRNQLFLTPSKRNALPLPFSLATVDDVEDVVDARINMKEHTMATHSTDDIWVELYDTRNGKTVYMDQ